MGGDFSGQAIGPVLITHNSDCYNLAIGKRFPLIVRLVKEGILALQDT